MNKIISMLYKSVSSDLEYKSDDFEKNLFIHWIVLFFISTLDVKHIEINGISKRKVKELYYDQCTYCTF